MGFFWYLVICGTDVIKSTCSFSPPFKSQEQCEFVRKTIITGMNYQKYREAKCIGVKK